MNFRQTKAIEAMEIMVPFMKEHYGYDELSETYEGSNTHSTIRDILSDLQHFCLQQKIDFGEVFASATRIFKAEAD